MRYDIIKKLTLNKHGIQKIIIKSLLHESHIVIPMSYSGYLKKILASC